MFFGKVESNIGEILNIKDSNGQGGGKAILAFWTELTIYCDGIDTHTLQWFEKAEQRSQEPLCSLYRPLIDSVVGGEWNYQADEYDLYLKRSDEPKLSEEEFLKGVHIHNHTWIDIEALRTSIRHIIELLESGLNYGDTLLDSRNVLTSFEALNYTLSFLAQRGATEARIRII
jgi:hypothetical protein